MSDFNTIKFIRIIKTFTDKELKSFDLWLHSPWCNTNKNLPILLEKVIKFHPTYDSPKLTKERLFKKILPNGKFSDRRINNLFSEGYLAAEKFVVFQNLTTNQNLQKDILTKEFQNRHLEDWFFRDINQEIDQLETKEIKNWEDHINLLQLHRRVYHHPNQNPKKQHGGITIVKMGEQIDLVYLLEKAAIINEKIFRNRILKTENHEVHQDLKEWRNASERIEHPTIDLYKMRFEYNEENMLEKYLELRKAFLDRIEELTIKDKNTHLVSLLNDTTKLIRAKYLDITEILPIYKLGIETEIIFTKGKLTHNTYTTILSISNYSKDFNYSNYFIKTYTQKLSKQIQGDAINWANAHLLYYKTKYSECLDILLTHDFNFFYFKLISKTLTTQVYFDLYLKDDSYESFLFNYFSSFEKWIYREKFQSEFYKQSYLGFIRVCRSLLKILMDPNYTKGSISKLLKKESNIQALNWLNEKRIKIEKLKDK